MSPGSRRGVRSGVIFRLLRATSRHILLADSSKLGRTDVARVCGLTDVDLLITGEGADAGVVAVLRERGLACQIAGLRDGG